MGYVEDNLVADESVMYRAHLHWAAILAPVLVGGVLMAGGIALMVGFRTVNWVLTGLVVLAIGGIFLANGVLRKRTAEFAVTNRRVIMKEGLARRRTVEVFLNKIESVGVDQTIPGRIFNYGTIAIHGTGGTNEPFHKLARPLEFRRHVQDQIARFTQR